MTNVVPPFVFDKSLFSNHIYVDNRLDERTSVIRHFVPTNAPAGPDDITNWEVEIRTNYYPVLVTNGDWVVVQFRKRQ